MALIDAPQFNYATQDRQFGQFGSDNNLVKPNDIASCLASAPSGLTSAAVQTPAVASAEQYALYKANPSVPQFKGVFTS
jgi:hypothetical protein